MTNSGKVELDFLPSRLDEGSPDTGECASWRKARSEKTRVPGGAGPCLLLATEPPAGAAASFSEYLTGAEFSFPYRLTVPQSPTLSLLFSFL